MARKLTTDEKEFDDLLDDGEIDKCFTIYRELTGELKDCRSILNDLLARMVDVYDGAEGADNRMPFAGSDIEDIRRVVG